MLWIFQVPYFLSLLQTRMGWCERTLNGNDLNGHEHFERTEHNSINTKYFLLWA